MEVSPKLRLLVAGSTCISSQYWNILQQSECEIVGLLTKQAKPKGRGLHISDPHIKNLATLNRVPVFQPHIFNVDFVKQLTDCQADLGIIIDYGKILPHSLISNKILARFGWWNVHFSCLPTWRGPAPVHHAIINGDCETGVTIIHVDAGMDTGPILATSTCPIEENDNTTTLKSKLSAIGQTLLVSLLKRLRTSRVILPSYPQIGNATIAKKIFKKDSKINWSLSASKIRNIIAACVEGPTAHFWHPLFEVEVKVFEADVVEDDSDHEKTVVSVPNNCGVIKECSRKGVTVQTGCNSIRIRILQLPCSRKMPAWEAVTSRPDLFRVGSKLM